MRTNIKLPLKLRYEHLIKTWTKNLKIIQLFNYRPCKAQEPKKSCWWWWQTRRWRV